MLPAVIVGLIGISLMGHYNHRTTGNPLLLPHLLNERTYSPLPLFIGQKPKPGLVFRDPVFEKFFQVTEKEYRYQDTKTVAGVIGLEAERFGGDWLFYVGPALSFPVLLGLFLSITKPGLRIVAAVALSTAIALALCIYSMPHYASPATIVVYVLAIEGLRYLWQQRNDGERAFVVAVCLAVVVASLTRQTGSAAINSTFALPNARKLVAQQLEDKPGKQLVLVSYNLDQHYPGNELVHNGAEFSAEKILWARSKGHENDLDLCQDYSDRTFWSVRTDDKNVSLTPLALCK